MKVLLRITLYFAIIFHLFSCSEQNKNVSRRDSMSNSNIELLSVSKSKVSLNLHGRKDNFLSIKLDSTVLIANISKMLIYNSLIYILDRKTNNFICFDKTGTYKWNYKKVGEAPGEHNDLVDFSIRKDKIYLFDKLNKILILNSKGEYLSEKKVSVENQKLFADLLYVNDLSEYVFYTSDMGDKGEFPFKIISASSDLKKIHKVYLQKMNAEGDSRWDASEFPVQVYGNNKGFFYTEALNDTIYRYDNGTMKRAYLVDFGKNKMSKSYLDLPKHTLSDFWHSPYGGNITGLFETDSLLAFRTTIGGEIYNHLVKKSTMKVSNYNIILLNLGDFICSARFMYSDKDSFYFIIEPNTLIDAYRALKNTKYSNLTDREFNHKMKIFNPLFYDLLNGINLYSNPIIMSIKIPN